MAFQITLQGVQRPRRSGQVFWLYRLIKCCQLKAQTGSVRGLNTRLATGLKKALQSFVSEAFNH